VRARREDVGDGAAADSGRADRHRPASGRTALHLGEEVAVAALALEAGDGPGQVSGDDRRLVPSAAVSELENTTSGIRFIASAIGPEALGQKVAQLVEVAAPTRWVDALLWRGVIADREAGTRSRDEKEEKEVRAVRI
jgi:hypothetical protein